MSMSNVVELTTTITTIIIVLFLVALQICFSFLTHPALAADGVDLVENDDVQARGSSFPFPGRFCGGEKRANLLLAGADELVEHLGAVAAREVAQHERAVDDELRLGGGHLADEHDPLSLKRSRERPRRICDQP